MSDMPLFLAILSETQHPLQEMRHAIPCLSEEPKKEEKNCSESKEWKTKQTTEKNVDTILELSMVTGRVQSSHLRQEGDI